MKLLKHFWRFDMMRRFAGQSCGDSSLKMWLLICDLVTVMLQLGFSNWDVTTRMWDLTSEVKIVGMCWTKMWGFEVKMWGFEIKDAEIQ